MKEQEIKDAVTKLLLAIGEDPNRDGLVDTPRRISEMYGEIFEGLSIDPTKYLNVDFEVAHDEMVILRNIPFYSMCEHHLLPFFGHAHIAYIPNGKIIGLSKIPRMVDMFARRLQVQERMTQEIANSLNDALNPRGVAIIIEAQHMCMHMRGVEKKKSEQKSSKDRNDTTTLLEKGFKLLSESIILSIIP